MSYPHIIPQTERQLLKDFPREIHFHIHRYPVDTLLTSKEDLQLWYHKWWEEKEERLHSFYLGEKTFYFMGQTVIPPCKSERRILLVKLLPVLYWTLFSPAVCLLSFVQSCSVVFYNHHYHLRAAGENIWWTGDHWTCMLTFFRQTATFKYKEKWVRL